MWRRLSAHSILMREALMRSARDRGNVIILAPASAAVEQLAACRRNAPISCHLILAEKAPAAALRKLAAATHQLHRPSRIEARRRRYLCRWKAAGVAVTLRIMHHGNIIARPRREAE